MHGLSSSHPFPRPGDPFFRKVVHHIRQEAAEGGDADMAANTAINGTALLKIIEDQDFASLVIALRGYVERLPWVADGGSRGRAGEIGGVRGMSSAERLARWPRPLRCRLPLLGVCAGCPWWNAFA